MIRGSLLVLLLLATILLPFSSALSLRTSTRSTRARARARGPMVQHISLPTTTTTASTTVTEQRMTATTADVVNGAAASTASAPCISSTLNPIQSALVKVGMLSFIAGMCISLPLTLFPPWILWKLGVLRDSIQKEKAALRTGQYCARFLSRLIPFVRVQVDGSLPPHFSKKPKEQQQQPSVWVCNHSSMLDVFILLANDHRLRGKDRRPIKIVYWKQLEDNPITKLLFRQCGFIPVQMADNGHGKANDYDRGSFKALLKDTKRAFDEGFDIGILPEGQLNPTPEQGLLPVFSGAYTLAKMSSRRQRSGSSPSHQRTTPIHMMAHYGIHNLWHPTKGMSPNSRNVKVRIYPEARYFESSEEFIATFNAIVGTYATSGQDLPAAELEKWTNGSAWETIKISKKESK